MSAVLLAASSVRRPAVAAAVVGLLAIALPRPAVAHPLGAPATALIELTDPATVRITWTPNPDDLVALARHLGLATAADDALTEEESTALAASDAFRAYVEEGLRATQAGAPCRTTVTAATDASNTPVAVTCPVPLAEAAATMELTLLTDIDERYTTLAIAPGNVRDTEVLFTAASPTHRLETRDGDVAVVEAPREDDGGTTLGGAGNRDTRLVALVQDPGRLGTVSVLAALGLAALVGAAHALAPGHGKAVAAAYLVGDRGRPRHAVALGVVVAAMHSLSTLVLGLVLWRARASIDLAGLSGGLRLASGGVIVAVGVVLLRKRWAERRHRPGHAHDPHDHHHDHADPLSRGGLAALAAAGGLLPSPTGVLVVVGALTVGRLALGISLVAAFSVGLAATVTATGLVALAGRDLLRRGVHDRVEAATTWLPIAGAVAVIVVGLVVAATGR